MYIKTKKGFTLAEMLLSIVIIGVIAAITIPALKDSSDKSANIASMKKAYSVATNAFSQIEAELGPPIYWKFETTNEESETVNERVFSTTAQDKGIAFLLKKQIISNGNTIPEEYSIKTLKGDEFSTGSAIDTATININGEGSLAFQSTDGMYWFPSAAINGCSYTKKDDKDKEKTIYLCGLILVDINGSKKPNRFGIDVFAFDITPDGVIAHGGETDECSNIDSDTGYTCSSKILMEGEKALDFIYE